MVGLSMRELEERRRSLAKEVESMRREREQRAPVSDDPPAMRVAPESIWPKYSPRETTQAIDSSVMMERDRALDVSTTATSSFVHSASNSALTGWPTSQDARLGSSSSRSRWPRLDGVDASFADSALTSSSFPAYNGAGSTSSSTGVPSSTALGEKSSGEIPSRLGHADLIARAREVGRQTVDAIERAKSSMDRSRFDASSYSSQADPSCRASNLNPHTFRSNDILASTLAVDALRSSESCVWRGSRPEGSTEASHLLDFSSARASSPRPSTSCLMSPGRAETHPPALRDFSGARGSSPRPSTSRLMSPGRAETHPDLHWGATSLIRPAHRKRDQLRTPVVGAYPPSPEDSTRTPLNASPRAASSRSGMPALSPRAGTEAWHPRPVDTLPSYRHDSPLSPRLFSSSSADHYRSPRTSRSLWPPSAFARCKADIGMHAHSSLDASLLEEVAGSTRGSPSKCSSVAHLCGSTRGSPSKCSTVGASSRRPSPLPFRTMV